MNELLAILIGIGIYCVAQKYDANGGFSRKWWKGYFMGILYFSPLIVLLYLITTP